MVHVVLVRCFIHGPIDGIKMAEAVRAVGTCRDGRGAAQCGHDVPTISKHDWDSSSA